MSTPLQKLVLDFLLIYILLSRNVHVEIYALFPQIFCDWKADSAKFSLLECMAGDARKHLFGCTAADKKPPCQTKKRKICKLCSLKYVEQHFQENIKILSSHLEHLICSAAECDNFSKLFFMCTWLTHLLSFASLFWYKYRLVFFHWHPPK